jgi:acetolactate synthase-1/3 small subunit
LTGGRNSGILADLFMRHTLSVLVENRFGVLTRVAGMFSGRGFNIDTLNVAPTLDASMSRMTLVVRGDDKVLEQVVKQTEKLVDVIKVDDFRDDEFVDRELVLMRVNVNEKTRSEVLQICDVFRAKIVDVRLDKLVIEITGNEGKIAKFISLMEHFGIAEMTRTGKVALSRTADSE